MWNLTCISRAQGKFFGGVQMVTPWALHSSASFLKSSTPIHIHDPCAAEALAAAVQVDGGLIARDAREVIATPAHILKTQLVDIKPEAGLRIIHA